MKLNQAALAAVVLIVAVTFLPQTERSAASHSLPRRAPTFSGIDREGISRLIDKVARDVQVAKEEKLAEEAKRPPPPEELRVAQKTEKVPVPQRVLELWSLEKEAGILFGAHAISGPGMPFEELQRQKRERCQENPGINYWSCRPEGEKYHCEDCYQVYVKAAPKDLGARRWEPRPPGRKG